MPDDGESKTETREPSSRNSAAEMCRAFEKSWQTPSPRPVEAFIGRAPEADRQALLFGLLRREISYRRLQGDEVSLEQYTRRFPDQPELLAALFTSTDQLRKLFDQCGYELSDKIESGRTGDVYRVIRRTDNRLYAVKVIPAFLVRPDAFEGDQVVNLDYLLHPHIARPTELIEAGGNLLFFNDYVEGMNFAQLVDRYGRLSTGIACELVRQVATGLAQLHDHYKAHGALTPTTLVLSVEEGAAGVVKMGSVGLTDVADLTMSRFAPTRLQTELDWRLFAAPEIADNASVSDPRCDVYSLGCTLQYLLSGRRPRDTESPRTSKEIRVLWSTATSDRSRRHVPRELKALMARMMAEDAADRFSSAAEVVEILARHADRDEFLQFVPQVEQSVSERVQRAGGVLIAGPDSSGVAEMNGAAVSEDVAAPAGSQPTASSTSDSPARSVGWTQMLIERKWVWYTTAAVTLLVITGWILVGRNIRRQVVPAWGVTLVELPGPSGDWWFDVMPWYAPSVRAEIARRAASGLEIGTRADVEALGRDLAAFRRPDHESAISELARVTEDVVNSTDGDESLVVRKLLSLGKREKLTRHDLQQEYRLLVRQLDEPKTATAYHLRALLQHSSADHADAAADYREAVERYQAGDSPLLSLCVCDYARLCTDADDNLADAADQLEAVAVPSAQSVALRVDAHCLRADVFRKFRGQYREAKRAVADAEKVADAGELPRVHPLRCLILETRAWIAVDDWRLRQAKGLLRQARDLRSLVADQGYEKNWRREFRIRQSLATVEHFLGNQGASQEMCGELLDEINHSTRNSMLSAVSYSDAMDLNALRPGIAEQLGDSYLFGPDYDYPQACEKYGEALRYAHHASCRSESEWPSVVSLRYKCALALGLAGQAKESAAQFAAADAELEERCVGAIDATSIALGETGLPAQQVAAFQWNRAVAKAYQRLQSGDGTARLQTQRRLQSLLARLDVNGTNLNMYFLAAQILLERTDCEKQLMMETVARGTEMAKSYMDRIGSDEDCGYFRRYADVFYSAWLCIQGHEEEGVSDNRKSMLAVLDRARRVSTRRPTPDVEHELPVTAKLHTLAVGVADYQHHSESSPLNLESADDDAHDLHLAYDCLRREGASGEKNPFGIYRPSIHSRVLTNRDATRGRIWRFVEDLRRIPTASMKEDLVIVSLSGHGVEDIDGSLFFLPFDYHPDSLLSTAVDMKMLMHQLRQLSSKVLLIIDTCHSGAAARSVNGRVATRSTDEDIRVAIKRMAETEQTLAVLMAGKAREKAGESRAFGGHGALTAAVLEFLTQKQFDVELKGNRRPVSLRGGADEALLTLEHLRRYVTDRVDQFPYINQRPILTASGEGVGNYSFGDIPLRLVKAGK